MTFEQTLLCARNLSLRPSMRSKYIRLMKGMLYTWVIDDPVPHASYIYGLQYYVSSVHVLLSHFQ